MERTLIATTPAAMEAAQGQMIEWAKKMVADVGSEVAQLREELQIAQRNKWNTKSIERRLKREGKRLTFYTKIRKALEAGYYVVPNFPGEAFAIRTDATKPKGRVERWNFKTDPQYTQDPKLLSEGEGRYVSSEASFYHHTESYVNKDGEERRRNVYMPADLEPVEFPVALMKPEAMQATERAMALKVFDEILEARDQMRCGDPMILGRLRNPQNGRPDMTFFIAWVMPLDRI